MHACMERCNEYGAEYMLEQCTRSYTKRPSTGVFSRLRGDLPFALEPSRAALKASILFCCA